MATAILLFLPISVYFFYLVIMGNLASPLDWVLGIVLGIALNYLGILKNDRLVEEQKYTLYFFQQNRPINRSNPKAVDKKGFSPCSRLRSLRHFASAPSPKRNLPSYWFSMMNYRFLVDCGEDPASNFAIRHRLQTSEPHSHYPRTP